MIRNPLIATVLYYNRTIDAFGTGFERVFKLCSAGNYQYSNNQFGFTFEFIRSKDTTNDTINDITNDSARTLTDDEKATLSFFKRTPHATKSALAIELGKSVSTANSLGKAFNRNRSAQACWPEQGRKVDCYVWVMQVGDLTPRVICHQLKIRHKTKCMPINGKERSQQRLRSLLQIEKMCFIVSLIGMGYGYINRW